MNRYNVLALKGILVNVQQACSAEIDNAVPVDKAQDFTDAIKLGTRAVVYEITRLDLVIRPEVIWKYHREPFYSI